MSLRIAKLLLVCLAAFYVTCGRASAVGKVTLDPNRGGVAAPAALQADARLAQKVTYEAQYRSVRKILEDLATMTKITLYAGSGKNDWPVRSRKMNIFVKDVRLSDLMNSIAHAMKFKWSPSKDLNPPTYRLVVDAKAVAAADAMLKHAQDEYEKLWQKRRQDWIDAIMKYGAWSASQIETLRETDPVVYRYARYGAVNALRALFTEVPETKERYAAGQGFRISSIELSGETQTLLYNTGNEYWKYLQMIGYIKKPVDAPAGYGRVLQPADGFEFAFVRMDEAGGFTPGLRWGGATQESTGYFHFIRKNGLDLEVADLRAIDDSRSRVACEANNHVLDGEPMPSDMSTRYATAKAESKKQQAALYPDEPLDKHSDLGRLEKTTKLKLEAPKGEQNPVLDVNRYIASFEKALADATGMGVVSDSWVNIAGEKVPDQEMKLSDLLDKFANQFDYNWDKSSAILEFRHRKWWKNRLNQIPDEWVTSWSANTAKGRVLGLDDLAQISTLNYGQAEESLKADNVLGTAGTYKQMLDILDANGNLHWLRLYASLSPQMRDLLMGQGGVTGNGGVNGHMLNAEQWRLAQKMFDRIGSTRSDALFYLRLLPSSIGNIIYEFKEVDAESGRQDRLWAIALPKYTPPPAGQNASQR